MSDVRTAFVDCATRAANVLDQAQVAECWNAPSVLNEFSVAGLAGHLLRALKTVELYLDGPEPDGVGLSAAQYYHGLALTPDLDSSLNRDVRSRGEETASAGATAVAAQARTLTDRLASRLAHEAPDRRVQVLGNVSITLDEYLRTRVVELVVHTDDLALSVGISPPADVTIVAGNVAIETLVDLARLRHGDVAVLRALTRRERDSVDALRVL